MLLSHMILIALAGFAAGAINALVGSGTLVTFPTLVALGYPPVTATMSNAVGLVAGSVSGTWGYRAELSGQWDRLRWQIPASLAGAVVGAFLCCTCPRGVRRHRAGAAHSRPGARGGGPADPDLDGQAGRGAGALG
ncbi:hypothetical protein MSAS_00110 [Mycobacterium saskatchewanense]|nr:hypothetical protein MSAS_00110 [Mycobacterium saskatchewanense]